MYIYTHICIYMDVYMLLFFAILTNYFNLSERITKWYPAVSRVTMFSEEIVKKHMEGYGIHSFTSMDSPIFFLFLPSIFHAKFLCHKFLNPLWNR
jgi:hypothetical protein